MKHLMLVTLLTVGLRFVGVCQDLVITRIDPPNWWVGMEWDTVQVMVYGDELTAYEVEIEPKGPKVLEIHPLENDHYSFIDIAIPADLKAGTYTVHFRKGENRVQLPYPILARSKDPLVHQGFDATDVVYLITPDRFADGDVRNQRAASLTDDYDPYNPGSRHGGDLQGIMDHLDYLQDLGVTALWLNPVLENAGNSSYHGYATTDMYKIDPRFGSNELYKRFVEAAHSHGLKVIFDHINNHIGIQHPWMDDLPSPDWVNGSKEAHWDNKHYKKAITDSYGDSLSLAMLNEFWFVDAMPDLNQHNPYLATYLIQNTLWWIEYAGLDGIREDTYPYPFQDFMAEWAEAVLDEYPQLNIVGEIWDLSAPYIASFQQGTHFPREFDSHLPTVMDFPLSEAFRRYIRKEGRLQDIYEVYADDFVYANPQNLMVFLDNHDMTRAIYEAEKDPARVKLALALMLSTRGIPQLFYGTELNLYGGPRHIDLREDFPGGFPNDERSAFNEEDRTAYEQDMFTYLQQLLKVRRDHPALSIGTFQHYHPINEIYMYFKEYEGEKIWVIANGHAEPQSVPLWDVQHMLTEIDTLHDLFSNELVKFDPDQGLRIQGYEVKMYKL